MKYPYKLIKEYKEKYSPETLKKHWIAICPEDGWHGLNTECAESHTFRKAKCPICGTMVYEVYIIRHGREVVNSLLHIGFGGGIAHTFLPYLPIWATITILVTLGSIREYIQKKRGKLQPFYIHCIDAIGFGLGGYGWSLLKIKVDEV